MQLVAGTELLGRLVLAAFMVVWMLPADQLQSTLTSAQQGLGAGPSTSSAGCSYPLGPICVDGALGVGAFGVGAVMAIAAIAIMAREAR